MTPQASTLWRSLEEAADDPTFLARAAQEFPGLAAAVAEPRDRRQVLRLMAAALAMGGLGGCDLGQPSGTLIPAVKIPPNIIPALPNFYATAHVLDGYASGVVVKHNMGRPVKVDGNPNHPASLGATDVFAQARVLDFYDPGRAAQITKHRDPSDRQSLEAALSGQRAALAQGHGAGLRVLTGTVTSPTLAAQLDALLKQYPEAHWHQWEPVSRDAVRRGATLAYGQLVDMLAHVDKADIVVAIDSDLLSTAPGHLRHARDFAGRRNPSRTQTMSRVYAIEPTPTLIGSVADHRFIAGPKDLPRIVTALAAGLLRNEPTDSALPWMAAVVADLKAARNRALVHVGPDQPAEMHALAHAMNEALGARGTTFDLIAPVAHQPVDQATSLRELIAAMQAGEVTNLLIIDSNPVFTTPTASGFAKALEQVPFSLALAGNMDETALSTTWFVPMAHEWETWSDARAYDGTATLLQPQALPLYDGVGAHEMLALYMTPAPISAEQAVQATWKQHLGDDFAKGWADALAAGVVAGTAGLPSDLRLLVDAEKIVPAPSTSGALSLLFRPDPSLWDGRFANNPWLQELPRPLTKLVWDNPLLIAPDLAKRMALQNGERVRLSVGQASVVAPVWIMPGQAPGCITALLGSGRRAAGMVGDGSGYNYYPLTGLDSSIELHKEKGRDDLASTVHHNLLLETPPEILRHGTLADFIANPRFAANEHPEPHIYRKVPAGPAAWAMSVDLNACIGCNACVGRLPGGEQHRRRRQGAGSARARDALAAYRSLFRR